MPRLISSLAALLLLAAASPALADAAPVADDHDDIYEVPRLRIMALASGGQTQRGVTLYLERHGGQVVGGWDNAARGTSSIALGADGEVAQIPAYRGGDRRWAQVVACVRDRFADFAVDVVTERPAAAGYSMIMVGGSPSVFNYSRNISGVAPYNGEVMIGAIGYVFSDTLDNDVEGTCTSIVHEAGHTFGLDHAYLCEDPMTYLWGCGEKRFQDVDAACGESDTRACATGAETQNSYRHLARYIGLRDGDDRPPVTPAREPAPPVVDDPSASDDDPPASDDDGRWSHDDDGDDADVAGWDDDTGCDADAHDPGEPAPRDTTAPQVSIAGRAEQLPGNQWTEIVVRASDDDALADVELGWASEESQVVISCAAPPVDMPVECVRDGNTFRFRMLVGVGLRGMVARATDRAGNQAISDARVVYFDD